MKKERSVSPTDEYQIKKTYDKTDVSYFGAADTKIKQLQVRMQEMEQQQLEIVKQNSALKAELRRSADTIPAKKCQAIEEMLVNLANDVMDNQKEFIQALKKHGESDAQVVKRNERMIENIKSIFDEMGRGETMAFIT